MSEPESTPPVPEAPEPDASEPVMQAWTRRPSRMRRFFLRHLPRTVAGVAILLAVTVTALYFLASTASFENFVRGRVVHRLELATGGRVEIRAFHWNLLRREAEARFSYSRRPCSTEMWLVSRSKNLSSTRLSGFFGAGGCGWLVEPSG